MDRILGAILFSSTPQQELHIGGEIRLSQRTFDRRGCKINPRSIHHRSTEASYQIAIDVLKDRFGRDDFKREVLMANLLQLPGVTNSNDLKSLRRLVDDFAVNVRSLEALNTPSSRYGEVLLPVMKEKIPEEWRLQWARIKNQDAGTSQTSEFERFVKYLHDEMRIREDASHVACTKVSSKNTETVPVMPHRSAVSILSSQRAKVQAKPPEPRWLCMACGQGQHGLSRCDRYHRMTVDERWEVVKKAGLCFQCLGPHLVRQCRSRSCHSCGQSHHSSLHQPARDRPSITASGISPQATPFVPKSSSTDQSKSTSDPSQQNEDCDKPKRHHVQVPIQHHHSARHQPSTRPPWLKPRAGPGGVRYEYCWMEAPILHIYEPLWLKIWDHQSFGPIPSPASVFKRSWKKLANTIRWK